MGAQMLAVMTALPLLGLSDDVHPRAVVPPEEMDVFVPVHHPNCVASTMVEHLNIYLGPRRILIATAAENCPAVEAYAENVRCLDEDRTLAGNITKQWVSDVIDGMLGADVADVQVGHGGRSTAGWYMQQFLKLGVVNSPLLRDDPISKVYLVWDADMILVNKFDVYGAEGRTPLMAGGNRHSFFFLREGGAATEEAELADSILREGGAATEEAELAASCNHQVVFERLTGMIPVSPPSGEDYVPHHMVMRSFFVQEMLEELGGKEQWVWNILGTSCGNGDGYAFCQCGFSEYDSMASFVKRKHPDAVFDRVSNYTHYKGGCCPHTRHFEMNSDKLFVGFGQEACDDEPGADDALLLQQSALRR